MGGKKLARMITLTLLIGLTLFISGEVAGQPDGNTATGRSTSELRVTIHKSLVVTVPETLERVSVADSSIANAVVISPKQLLVNGLSPGETSLVLWNERGEAKSFDLRVEMDLGAAVEAVKQAFGKEQVQIVQSGSSLVVSGTVTSQAEVEGIGNVLQTFSPAVVNLLVPEAPSDQAVLLSVRFAEVDRAALQNLGLNIFSTGAGNTFGSMTTQQFGQFGAKVGALGEGAPSTREPQQPNTATGSVGAKIAGMPAVFGLSDLANIFLFRSDANIGVTIKALEQKNLLEILAEPNVLALNGREASFLAGGEFPFPVIQGGGAFQSLTIVFKEFGVRLKFTPNIKKDGTIFLKVAPEVSALDFANALTVEGFVVPALTTRRAETEIALRDGQTFAIAGLIDNRITEVVSKVPGLGDIPFIGKLFRSRSRNRSTTELLVLVSPKLVSPLDAQDLPPLPPMPIPLGESGSTLPSSGR